MERIWSTEDVPEPERFAYWREVVTRAFVDLRPERVTRGPFFGLIRARAFGHLRVAEIRSGAQRVYRSPSEIARSPHEVYFVNLQVAGTSTFHQGRETALLKPGDLVLVDATRPFQMGFDRSFLHVSFKLPHHALRPSLARPDEVGGTVLAGRAGLGRLVSRYARAAAVDGADAAPTADGLVALLAVAVGASANARQQAQPSVRAARLREARAHVDRHLADPALSPGRIAADLRMSTRYLHVLFAESGESPMQWVIRRRLERCRSDLARDVTEPRSITEIAFGWGFQDLTHFGRAFKAAYGMTPRDWRREATLR